MAATLLHCKNCNNTLFYSYIDNTKEPPGFYYICARCKKMFKAKNQLEKGEPQEDPASYIFP
jgi:hypothetical protein